MENIPAILCYTKNKVSLEEEQRQQRQQQQQQRLPDPTFPLNAAFAASGEMNSG